jgi:molybdate transport system substrate-binding protein
MKQWLSVMLCLFAALQLRAATVMVFAAASLTDSLKQVAGDYEKSSGDTIVFNFAASGVLARQIEAGAPVDIFFSADERQMDAVAAKDLIVPESRHDLLGNSLVIVTAPDNSTIHSATDLTNAAVQRIALGDWKSVPAGTYAKAYLEKTGCWGTVGPKVVQSENVRAVLAVVESGNADAGFVYKTDAAISKKVQVAYEVPPADGPKIVYPAAVMKESAQREAAMKFLAFLQSENAGEVFRKFGFMVLDSSHATRSIQYQRPKHLDGI